MLTTSFRRLKDHQACTARYRHLAKALGGITKYGRDKPIPLVVILEHNRLEDTMWALPTVPDSQRDEMIRVSRLFACRCVRETPLADGRKVWDLLEDERSREAVRVAERHAVGEATDAARAAACDDACDAARAAACDASWYAARAAAWAATRADAAWDASYYAARAATYDDARDASWHAAWYAAWAAARDAEAEILREMLSETEA